MEIKQIIFMFFLVFSVMTFDQDINLKISETYINPFGRNSKLTSYSPLFKLDSDSIHNRQHSLKIKLLPKTILTSKTGLPILDWTQSCKI